MNLLWWPPRPDRISRELARVVAREFVRVWRRRRNLAVACVYWNPERENFVRLRVVR